MGIAMGYDHHKNKVVPGINPLKKNKYSTSDLMTSLELMVNSKYGFYQSLGFAQGPPLTPRKTSKNLESTGSERLLTYIYHLVMTNIAMENHHL